jgi:signal transduction histidine kinase
MMQNAMFYSAHKSLGDGRAWQQRLVKLGFIWGIWSLVGIFFASQLYVYFARTERALPFTRALVWQLAAVYLFASFTPLVLWLSRRFRFERSGWWRVVLVHALAGTLIATVWSAGHTVLDIWFYGDINKLTVDGWLRRTFVNLDKELLVYWVIVLISQAANFYQRYREGELRASQAQLQALKMQLHPHFLFNALHSISELVHKDPEAADRMIARLGDFLRLTLETSATQEVQLRQELDFLNCYLDIERVRFNDRLTTRVEVEPQALNCRVPNLILQPLVENAIRHGIAVRTSPGHVEVRAARRKGVLRLEVVDDGPGLRSGEKHGKLSGQTGNGVGLANTQGRLQRLYGNAHSFEMINDPRGGLVVSIEIPFADGSDANSATEEYKTGLAGFSGLTGSTNHLL